MNDRFLITGIYICPVDRVGIGFFKPNLNYPVRYCVIDNKTKIAIDIKTKLKYDYILTVNHKDFIDNSNKKIEPNKRVAIFPNFTFEYDNYDLEEVKRIIERLKNNERFADGNDALNNEQYLEYIKREENANTKEKTKKIGKRRK